VSKAIGRRAEVENALVSRLRAHGFMHGNAVADGRILLFFYFEHADAGIAMLIPEIHGQMEVARLPRHWPLFKKDWESYLRRICIDFRGALSESTCLRQATFREIKNYQRKPRIQK
jgi:hypothetical protein